MGSIARKARRLLEAAFEPIEGIVEDQDQPADFILSRRLWQSLTECFRMNLFGCIGNILQRFQRLSRDPPNPESRGESRSWKSRQVSDREIKNQLRGFFPDHDGRGRITLDFTKGLQLLVEDHRSRSEPKNDELDRKKKCSPNGEPRAKRPAF